MRTFLLLSACSVVFVGCVAVPKPVMETQPFSSERMLNERLVCKTTLLLLPSPSELPMKSFETTVILQYPNLRQDDKQLAVSSETPLLFSGFLKPAFEAKKSSEIQRDGTLFDNSLGGFCSFHSDGLGMFQEDRFTDTGTLTLSCNNGPRERLLIYSAISEVVPAFERH